MLEEVGLEMKFCLVGSFIVSVDKRFVQDYFMFVVEVRGIEVVIDLMDLEFFQGMEVIFILMLDVVEDIVKFSCVGWQGVDWGF